MTVKCNDAIKLQVPGAEQLVIESSLVIKNWLEEQLKIIAVKAEKNISDFLKKIPVYYKEDENNFKCIYGDFPIFKDFIYTLEYDCNFICLSINIDGPVPLEIIRALKVCKLFDWIAAEKLINNIEFKVEPEGKILINTKFNISQVTTDWSQENVSIRLLEYNYKNYN